MRALSARPRMPSSMTTFRSKAMSWYAQNRDRVLPLNRARIACRIRLAIKMRTLILSAQPCMDCGEPPDPDTPFEFDHRESIGSKAQRRMSDLISKGASIARLVRELSLCDVVCPTCHKKRTFARGEWKRSPVVRDGPF